ncbi:MAG: sigma-70 family RNA polymerase sigma factor [Pseudolabrys sp.]
MTSAKLFGVCVRILGERAEAEDVLQEVYVTVWRKAADFDASRASPMTWLIALARNRSIDRLRASRVSRNMDPIDSATEVADMAAAADTALESVQEHARLHGCLDAWMVSSPMSARHCAVHFLAAIPTTIWRSA